MNLYICMLFLHPNSAFNTPLHEIMKSCRFVSCNI